MPNCPACRVHLVCAAAILAACQSPAPERVASEQQPVLDNCIGGEDPAHVTPVYTQPADDGIALGSLLEGAGYATGDDSNWTDVAAGHLCASGQQIVMLRNTTGNFSVLGGPTPYPLYSGNLNSDPAHPWRAVTAGRLDAGAYDLVVAVRKVTQSGVPDLVVARTDPNLCKLDTIVATATIGNPNNSEWVDAAIGNFDGTGNQIALLKASGSYLFLERLTASGSLVTTYEGNLDSNPSLPWKAVAAGDLDGDGKDELVVARQVADSASATVLVYHWVNGGFQLLATSTFGNTGNSTWASMAVGDFNGDGRKSVALLKNAHSNFAVFDLPANSTTLRELATSDLDSVSGQDWRGLTATDWLGGDQGAAELIAIRAAHPTVDISFVIKPYLADVFVYGNPFHRIARDSGVAGARAAWTQMRPKAQAEVATMPATLVAAMKGTHTNTLNWDLSIPHQFDAQGQQLPGDYAGLVAFLDATRNVCIDGQHLRVWVTIYAFENESTVNVNNCNQVEESSITGWSDLESFAEKGTDETAQRRRAVDYKAWGTLIGHLAHDYPQLVAVNIDDYGNHPGWIPVETLAELQSRMRSQAPWLNFIPTIYYENQAANGWPQDLTRTFDSILYFFRNDSHGNCLYTPCGEDSLPNAPGEIATMAAMLPAGRKLQLGMYFGPLWLPANGGQFPRVGYDDSLTLLGMSTPSIGGLTAYPMQPDPGRVCTSFNYLYGDPPRGPARCGNEVCELGETPSTCGQDCPGVCGDGVCDFYSEDPQSCPTDCSRYCVLWKDFGQTGRCTPGMTQSCGNCGTQTCTSSFTWGACTGQGVCSPGQTQSSACGTRCGTRVDTCTDSCQWSIGSCGNEGVCSPGDRQACCPCNPLVGCSRQGEQLCTSSCSWGGCTSFACRGGSEP